MVVLNPNVAFRYVLFGPIQGYFFISLRIKNISCKNSKFEFLLKMEKIGLHCPCSQRQEQMPLQKGWQAGTAQLVSFHTWWGDGAFVVSESFSDISCSSTTCIIYGDTNLIVSSQYLQTQKRYFSSLLFMIMCSKQKTISFYLVLFLMWANALHL